MWFVFKMYTRQPYWCNACFSTHRCNNLYYITPQVTVTVARYELHALGHILAKHDVINFFLSAADAILKKKKFFENELLVIESPNLVWRFTLVNSAGSGASSYFRLATIRHFNFFFALRHRSPKRLDRISPNLVGLIYMSSDNFRHKIASSITSVREPSPSLCCELRRAVYSPPRRWALVSYCLFKRY